MWRNLTVAGQTNGQWTAGSGYMVSTTGANTYTVTGANFSNATLAENVNATEIEANYTFRFGNTVTLSMRSMFTNRTDTTFSTAGCAAGLYYYQVLHESGQRQVEQCINGVSTMIITGLPLPVANTDYNASLRINATGVRYTQGGVIIGESMSVGFRGFNQIEMFGYDNGAGDAKRFDDVYITGLADLNNLTSWGNNKTNNMTLNINLNRSENANFNATSNQTITTWNWLKDDINQNHNFNNITLNFSNDGIHTVKVSGTNVNGTGNTITWNLVVKEAGIPYLISPSNQSTQTISTLPYSQSFTWSNEGTAQYNIQVAQDSGFSILVADQNVATNQTSIGLWTVDDYYWRVRTYDGAAVYGNWSQTRTFTLAESGLPSSDGTTGIQGIAYEFKSSGNTPLSGVRVMVSNTTWTSSTTTDANGYYLFKNLSNASLYTLQGTKLNYEDSKVEYVTTINGTWYIKNLYLQACVSGFNCFYNQKYVQFIVKSPTGTVYEGVTVTVYKSGETTATHTGTTDSDGGIVFLLVNDQKYRITFVKSSQSINEDFTLYAKDDSYIIYVWGSQIIDRSDNISWALYSSDHNATFKWLNLTYTSNTTTTSGNFWVKNATGTILYSTTSSSFTTWNPNFTVNSSKGLAYTWGFNATHPTWGLIDPSEVIVFRSAYLIDLKLSDTRIYTWLSIGFLILMASMFSATTNKYGYILIPLFALFLWGIGWFPQGYQAVHFTVIMSALIIGALAYWRASEKKGAYPY